ncbi:hypothetical protein EBU24_00215 [bacterium]|nr:hypothetical protein [bacterium]
MSDVKTSVSPEQVQKTMSIVISTLKFVSTIIPGESDNKIVDVITSLSQEPWVIPAITFLINKFDKDKPVTSEDFLLAIKVAKNEV